MNDENGRIIVDGNFIMDSVWSHKDRLIAGTLEVKGDFTQKRSAYSSSSSYTNFRAIGTHKVVLSGTGDQVVSFASPLTTGSCFSVLELSNTSGTITFNSRAAVTGEINPQPGINLLQTENLYPAGTAEIIGGNWAWDLGISENWTLQHDLTVDCDLYLNSGNLYTNGFNLNITGTTHYLGGIIVI